MYLVNYDFYDIHGFFVYLRNKERTDKTDSAVTAIKKYIDDNCPLIGDGTNSVRKILRPFFPSCSPSWIFTDNEYTANIVFIKEKSRYDTLSQIFGEFENCPRDDNERYYLLCDSVHNIPLYLADLKHPSRTITRSLRPYSKKYSCGFPK